MGTIKENITGTEWSFVIEHYDGEITAEEFASQHNITAVNDNSDDSYQFVGHRENVERAYKEYYKN